MHETFCQGSVRVDLLGGTLDIYPINVVLDNVNTINCATSLMAKVSVSTDRKESITIISKDYNLEKSFDLNKIKTFSYSDEELGPLKFLMLLLKEFEPSKGLRITLESNAPAGSGLGGSSSMACVFFNALSEHLSIRMPREKMVEIIQRVESKILNQGPAGYQDYYPALFGGVLCLSSKMSGVVLEQLYTPELVDFLKSNITLVYSGESRKSGINNWEVYKGFFDGDEKIRKGLEEIRDHTLFGIEALKENNYKKFLECICNEGEVREKLFSEILTEKMSQLKVKLANESKSFKGTKVCGAGGGGCFLVVGDDKQEIKTIIDSFGMEVLDFSIEPPREGFCD